MLREEAEYQLYSLSFDQIRLKSTIYHTRGDHANHYTIDVAT